MDKLFNALIDPFNTLTGPFNAPVRPFGAAPALSQGRPQPSEAVRRLLEQPLDAFRKPGDACEPTTYAALVLDKSGSMLRHRLAALEGYNAQVDVIREGAKEAGKTLVSLTQFASRPQPVLVARPVSELRPLDASQYNPEGGTALYDAIGLTIEQLLEQPGIDAPTTAVLVAVFTDGEENSSVRYDGDTLKQLIARLEATGRWTFTLMGPQGSSLELASVLNISRGNVAMFDPGNQESTRAAFSTMAGAATNYMAMRGKGLTASASLYADLGSQGE
jgi:uncharacterized protein YegL